MTSAALLSPPQPAGGNDPAVTPERHHPSRSNALTVSLLAVTITGVAAVVGLVGADARWLAAFGAIIAHRGAIPAGVPFAAAPTADWHNTLALAQLIFHGLESALGDRGLMLAQLAAVAGAVVVLGRDALAGGATRQGTAAALMLAAVGALPELSVARVQLFSLVLFGLAAALLRRETRAPSRRIWLVVPLLALWSNLHGAALVGLGMTLAYLALGRLPQQPLTAVAVAVASVLAICLTPAGVHTIAYYHGVLGNQAAQRGEGLWAPLSLTDPLDVLLVIAAGAMAAGLRRSRAQLWEIAVLVVLAALSVKTGRSGVWLLFFLAPLAARTFRPRRMWDRLLPPMGTIALVLLLLGVVRGPLPNGATTRLIGNATALAHGSPILAEDLYSEQVALAGGRIAIGNPIDAFSKPEQAAYLDWLDGKPSGERAITGQVQVVLTGLKGPTERLMASEKSFRPAGQDKAAKLFVRTR